MLHGRIQTSFALNDARRHRSVPNCYKALTECSMTIDSVLAHFGRANHLCFIELSDLKTKAESQAICDSTLTRAKM